MRDSRDVSLSFQSVSDQITVRELSSVLKTSEVRYLVIERTDTGYVVWPLQGKEAIQPILDLAADRLGPRILELRLEQIPKLTEPCLPVEQNNPWSWAERWTRQDQSPARCTVVLKDGRIVGVLDSVSRGDHLISLPGLRFALFQVGEIGTNSDPTRLCPHCGRDFDFYEVRLDNSEPVYICPHCGQTVEDKS
jgi:hypothetical protein